MSKSDSISQQRMTGSDKQAAFDIASVPTLKVKILSHVHMEVGGSK